MGNVIKLYGPWDVIQNDDLAEYCTIHADRNQFLDAMAETVAVPGPVEEGDYLVASLYGQTPRYQRENVHIHVGTGIWGKAFEAALVGAKPGENQVALVGVKSGEKQVTQAGTKPEENQVAQVGMKPDENQSSSTDEVIRVVIHSIKRRQKAEVTDDYVCRQLMDGVETVQQLLERRIHDYAAKEKGFRLGRAYVEALQVMGERTEFADLTAQIEEFYADFLGSYQSKADNKGVTLDEVLGADEASREQMRVRIRERAVNFAHWYELVKELAASDGTVLKEKGWGWEVNHYADQKITPYFTDQFRILYEDGTEERI